MVKPTRSLITGSIETTSSTPLPIAHTPIEELLAIPKISESTADDTQSGNNDLPSSMSSKKPRLLKDDFGLIFAEYAKSKRSYDSSCVQKFDLLKSRGFIIEISFLEQSLIDHGLLELLVNSKFVHEFYANMDESIVDVGLSFYGVAFVKSEVVDFNVEELSAFLEIPKYHDVVGAGLKDDIDLDMVSTELTGGKPISMGQLLVLKRHLMLTEHNFKSFNRGLLLSKVMY
ncbi:hypothetical protein M9H77_30398 [Catharanthus roseus]|uniref:Uncharacterized protein n=1 Tax=Catharanthus roseus TaxID=4058 RepID=A0ACB9ZY16_CATRO|nr:hypothetical protein M9H77_30398 [Catharanthus roseus]